ncbi:MAG: lysozyme [Drouetiella hepatica Uher 2000/2452]|uniref:Lysozyme n=1 Tax=Drouetiella hepatica Uher 2000/2452 TaxID=904376 RepID=A0A951QF59_9CYAN|nr:lysozyme [Drouetiella hepatica Uher 2000/2452]
MSGFELVGTDHIKFTLGADAQGKQIFFKGRNTWYVYLSAVQLLRNGQPIAAPKPAPVYTVQTVLDTWLKVSAVQGSALSSEQKQLVSAGKVLPLSSYDWVENDHIKLTFGLDAQGKQIFFKGRNTWYVYRPAVRILKDGKAIALSNPAPASGQINAKGLNLLKSFEGLVLEAYIDAVGVLTIGYGTTTGVSPGMRITEAQAESFLKRDLTRFENAVRKLVKVPLNEDQFSALVSFTYNVGEGALGGSTLLSLLNRGDFQGAADQLLRWNRGDRGELPGLTRRRRAERALFLGQDFTAFL